MAHIDRVPSSVRSQLKADLNAESDDDRKLKSIPNGAAEAIFDILKIDYPNCDEDRNGNVSGDELKCLNLAWKAYVPH